MAALWAVLFVQESKLFLVNHKLCLVYSVFTIHLMQEGQTESWVMGEDGIRVHKE